MVEGKITVKIDERGEIEVTTRNIKGPSCVNEITELLKDLASITDMKKTDEYYMDVKVTQTTTVKQEVKE